MALNGVWFRGGRKKKRPCSFGFALFPCARARVCDSTNKDFWHVRICFVTTPRARIRILLVARRAKTRRLRIKRANLSSNLRARETNIRTARSSLSFNRAKYRCFGTKRSLHEKKTKEYFCFERTSLFLTTSNKSWSEIIIALNEENLLEEIYFSRIYIYIL